ncbi:MAG TPA: hypothetical protein DCS63_05090 [Elusimicrobia bacterium]|nr:hypothetical protein [Elusimicrobiota bacterium]
MNIKGKNQIAAIGVDRGGTWTRVAAIDARLRPVKTLRFRTEPLKTLPKALAARLARWPGGRAAPLVIATRGAFSRKWKKPFLFKALAGKLNLVDVISDAEAAHFAAFGGKAGHLLIAGTGAVVLSGGTRGFKKTGGFNPPSGDPGSGRWLGRQYLKMLGRLGEAGDMGHGRCAAYAKKALARAARGDKACSVMTAAAQHELAGLLKCAAGRSRGDIKAALAGGLMEDDRFRTGFLEAARRSLPGRRLVLARTAIGAGEAAARIALLRKGE